MVDVGGCRADIPEGPVECRLWGRTAWVHVPAAPYRLCDLGAPQDSVALSEKWVVRMGCEERTLNSSVVGFCEFSRIP